MSNKDKCQKFTPVDMVQKKLDLAGYTTNLTGKRVLENSFGSGNMLLEIVRRYIKNCLNQSIPLIEDTARQYLYPDTEGIQKAFVRDDQYYIKISDECKEDDTVKDFYKQINLGGEIHRLDYLLMSMIGMNSKMMDRPEVSQKIGQAIEMLRAKRNIMG
ncbi:hypothetical protein [Muricomes intestini]|nr:hypothetical protein [Muricomes intestini]